MRGCRANAVEPPKRLEDHLAKRTVGAQGREKVVAGKSRTGGPDEKPASLTVRCLTVCEGRSLVLIRLHTGRTHQIRVQLSERGFPLVGDVKYGGPRCGDGLKLPCRAAAGGRGNLYGLACRGPVPWRVAHLPPEWEDV